MLLSILAPESSKSQLTNIRNVLPKSKYLSTSQSLNIITTFLHAPWHCSDDKITYTKIKRFLYTVVSLIQQLYSLRAVLHSQKLAWALPS